VQGEPNVTCIILSSHFVVTCNRGYTFLWRVLLPLL
jgi:hypothetical protein